MTQDVAKIDVAKIGAELLSVFSGKASVEFLAFELVKSVPFPSWLMPPFTPRILFVKSVNISKVISSDGIELNNPNCWAANSACSASKSGRLSTITSDALWGMLVLRGTVVEFVLPGILDLVTTVEFGANVAYEVLLTTFVIDIEVEPGNVDVTGVELPADIAEVAGLDVDSEKLVLTVGTLMLDLSCSS